jgi:hypothetical protein
METPRSDPDRLESFVSRDPVVKDRIEKRQMVETGTAFCFFDHAGKGYQGDPVVFVIVGHERHEIVVVQNLCV